MMNQDGVIGQRRYCVFSKDIAIEDIGECIFRMENGTHLTHTQNFIARNSASRRGARFCGSKATLEINFITGELSLYSHVNSSVEQYKVAEGKLSHYGGDMALVKDFLDCMKYKVRPRTDLITGNGVMSTLACLSARESADTGKFIKIEL